MSLSNKLTIQEFLLEVPKEYYDFVSQVHEVMTKNKYKAKIEQKKKTGLTVTYLQHKKSKMLFQYFLREDVLSINFFAIFFDEFNGFLDNLPSNIIKEIEDYKNCTKSTNVPNGCNPHCSGPEFTIKNVQYHKCEYGLININVNSESTKLLSVLDKLDE